MKQIVREPDSGKTKELMEWTQKLANKYCDRNILYVCKNPVRYRSKAADYGIASGLLFGISFISYTEYLERLEENKELSDYKVVIDDVDEFLSILSENKIVGFTLSQEEKKNEV